MKRFTLLSNGQDLDTGIYEYFPYADKVVLNPKKVNKILGDLKKGSFPRDTNKYIYGRYCVSREEDYENVIKTNYFNLSQSLWGGDMMSLPIPNDADTSGICFSSINMVYLFNLFVIKERE